jgi:hypothetical protein
VNLAQFTLLKFNYINLRGRLDIGNSGIKFRRHSGGYLITGPQTPHAISTIMDALPQHSAVIALAAHEQLCNITTLQLIFQPYFLLETQYPTSSTPL